jgi:hypothetical protein
MTGSRYVMTEEAWHRLHSAAAALCIKVWRVGGRMFAQRPGEPAQEFTCDTLHSAGFIRCSRPSLGHACQADATHRRIGCGRVMCDCGAVSMRLPAVVLQHLANGRTL